MYLLGGFGRRTIMEFDTYDTVGTPMQEIFGTGLTYHVAFFLMHSSGKYLAVVYAGPADVASLYIEKNQ